MFRNVRKVKAPVSQQVDVSELVIEIGTNKKSNFVHHLWRRGVVKRVPQQPKKDIVI